MRKLKMTKLLGLLLAVSIISSSFSDTAQADPCGMVPPIYTQGGTPITRIGAQKTYVTFKDGVETIVLRPGFSGKIDEFGMLIPFPSVPAIRKVPDHIFPHIAAAIDPPEVVIDLRRRYFDSFTQAAPRSAMKKSGAKGEKRLEFNQVRVLKQEAIGMYEVAVIAAGSAKALSKWLIDHGFQYPKGMDKVCNEYVDARWCFVAVKTKVGQKEGVTPKAGQRSVKSKLPKGSTFDGFVQAMGFRFKTEKLVVPMRLSAFNAGELRNIVYLLTDGPQKIRSIPEEYVVRQVSGSKLFNNVTQPLPLRIIGGGVSDIPQWQRKTLKTRRNPEPHNGAARDLFASDMLAISTGKLSLPHEETEKAFLAIGEALGLRGAAIDKINAIALLAKRKETVDEALSDVKNLTLTVVDGDFPREVLAKQNLSFASYRMPANRNKSQQYDATKMGPGGKKQGVLKLGVLDFSKDGPQVAENSKSWFAPLALFSVLGLCFIGIVIGFRRKTVAVMMAVVLTISSVSLFAQGKEVKQPSVADLIASLSDKDKAPAAVEQLVKHGATAKKQLQEVAKNGKNLARRGWAISALASIDGSGTDEFLLNIHADTKQPMLVRTWAAAARVKMTKTTAGLIEKANLIATFPALGRPIGKRLIEQLSKDNGDANDPEQILAISLKVPKLQQALAPVLLAMGPKKLGKVLVTAKDQRVRRQAAAYLGTMAQKGDKTVGQAVIKVYQFDPKAKKVVWDGGPLFLPGINWTKEDATTLVGNLVAWHLWCDVNGKQQEQRQIYNNLVSLGLSRKVGYSVRSNKTTDWLLAWGKIVGKQGIQKMLKEQKLEDNKTYTSVLASLK